jgi:Flp pilus assembly pilin Flp
LRVTEGWLAVVDRIAALQRPVAIFSTGGRELRNYKNFKETKTMTNLRRLWSEEEGQDLVEYGLLVVLIALVAIAAMNNLASSISNVYANAAANLTT